MRSSGVQVALCADVRANDTSRGTGNHSLVNIFGAWSQRLGGTTRISEIVVRVEAAGWGLIWEAVRTLSGGQNESSRHE